MSASAALIFALATPLFLLCGCGFTPAQSVRSAKHREQQREARADRHRHYSSPRSSILPPLIPPPPPPRAHAAPALQDYLVLLEPEQNAAADAHLQLRHVQQSGYWLEQDAAADAHLQLNQPNKLESELWLETLGPLGQDSAELQLSQQKLELSVGPCLLQLYEPCRDHDSIIFYLFSSVDGRPSVLSVTKPELPEIFDPELPTKVLIHGFAGSVEFNFTASVRQAYLLRGGYNVLVVDWGRLTRLPCYPSSVINTWQVARCTGQLLAGLAALSPTLAPEHLHLVGFSLGAHIAAYVSDELQARLGRRIGRISGLDPALPAFASLSRSWKLDPEDADFVDVVHTNAGVFGKIEPTGHADFYVNGGSIQPFCHGGERNIPLCSHLLAPVYFAESILDEEGFWGRSCPSYGHYAWGYCPAPAPDALSYTPGTFMGEGADPRVHGTFIVETEVTPPFALGPPEPVPPPPPHGTQPTDAVFIVLSR